MAKRLTDLSIEKLAAKRKSYVVWDKQQTGLGVRITKTGQRIFILQTRFPGNRRATKRTLGHFSSLDVPVDQRFGIEAARDKAEAWRGLSKNGTDPAVLAARERRDREAAAQAEALRGKFTFGSYSERWIGLRKNRRAKIDGNEIRFNLFPAWRDKPIHEITPRDVRLLFADLIDRSAYAARNCWTHATLIFSQAVHEELIVASPLASLRKRLIFANAKIESRQRVLNEQEVFAFWRAAGRLRYPAGPCYRLLLLVGPRKNELAGAAWDELHPVMRKLIREAQSRTNARWPDKSSTPINWAAVPADHKTLTVPRERFKSDAEHVLHLTNDACAIIETLPRLGSFLFSKKGKKASWIDSHDKQRLDDRMLRTLKAQARMRGDDPSRVKLPHFTIHDLRRVVKSQMSALKVPDHISELVLGHNRKGLQKIYDQYTYAKEIREALEAWAERLRSIVAPTPPASTDNVVALRPGRTR